jgi:hypothetical protein
MDNYHNVKTKKKPNIVNTKKGQLKVVEKMFFL